MQQVIPFLFESFQVRVITLDGNPMFSARDVALALGYENPAKAYQDHCKLLKLLNYNAALQLKWVNPHPRGEYVMPESDVYRLIIKSAKPEAERFERWVFEEILPTIRKTGSYSIVQQPAPQPQISAISETADVVRVVARALKAAGLKGNLLTIAADNVGKSVYGISLLGLAGATHLIANPKGQTYTPTELGKMLSPPVSAAKLNLLLEASWLQTKEFGHWLPTDKADGLFEWLDTGKRHSYGTPVKQIKWFQSVLSFIQPSVQREAA